MKADKQIALRSNTSGWVAPRWCERLRNTSQRMTMVGLLRVDLQPPIWGVSSVVERRSPKPHTEVQFLYFLPIICIFLKLLSSLVKRAAKNWGASCVWQGLYADNTKWGADGVQGVAVGWGRSPASRMGVGNMPQRSAGGSGRNLSDINRQHVSKHQLTLQYNILNNERRNLFWFYILHLRSLRCLLMYNGMAGATVRTSALTDKKGESDNK